MLAPGCDCCRCSQVAQHQPGNQALFLPRRTTPLEPVTSTCCTRTLTHTHTHTHWASSPKEGRLHFVGSATTKSFRSYIKQSKVIRATHTDPVVKLSVLPRDRLFPFSPAMIGLLYPRIDSFLGEPHKFKREWSSVMRCVAVFVGINHASAVSLKCASSVQHQ